MKIGRQYLGKVVKLVWHDPNFARGPIASLVVGRAALATWVEYGVVHDITDGVVLIAHSYGTDVGSAEPDELCRTAIDESVVESIVVLEPVKEAAA